MVEFNMTRSLGKNCSNGMLSIENASEVAFTCEGLGIERPIVSLVEVLNAEVPKSNIENPKNGVEIEKVVVNGEVHGERVPPFDREKLHKRNRRRSRRNKKKSAPRMEWRVKEKPKSEWEEMIEVVDEMKSLLSVFSVIFNEKKELESAKMANGGSRGRLRGDPG